MPGIDHSDLIAFLRVIDAPFSDIAVRAAGFVETVHGGCRAGGIAPAGETHKRWAKRKRPPNGGPSLLPVNTRSAAGWCC
jgi:hypothetical protein